MRRSINAEGVPHHKNPIPHACVVRGVLVSSAISGVDRDTGRYLEEREQQIALAFEYLEDVLAAGGAGIEDVVKLDLFFSDKDDRKFANEHWLRLFPDARSRPARHAHLAELPDGCFLQIEAMAVLENADR